MMASAKEDTQEEEQKKEEVTANEPQEMNIHELELDGLRRQAEEYKDKYFRLLAETENTRKRMQKEKHELTQYALQNMICDILNPLDHLENALFHAENMSPEIQHWAIGFKMILEQFKDVLATNGVEAFSSIGKTFDPHHHEAIEVIHTDEHPRDTILEETVKGYRMGERTIRPARVKVAKPNVSESSKKIINNEKEDN